MKKMYAFILTLLFCLLPASLYAAEQNADGCNDHPLIPVISGYYIAACNDIPAGADMDIIKGETTETVHMEGKSTVFIYMPQSDRETKLSEELLRSEFENGILKMNGSLFGLTFGQKWPVYVLEKESKKYWIILMVDSGEYYNGSYACRIIEVE